MAHSRTRITRGLTRETFWIFVTETIISLGSPSTAVLINSFSVGLLAVRPFTIIRTHGFFGIRPDQIAADENFDAALGFAVVSDQASAIGVTAVPTPFTDMGSDLFFVHQMLMARFEFLSSIGTRNTVDPWI